MLLRKQHGRAGGRDRLDDIGKAALLGRVDGLSASCFAGDLSVNA